MMIMQTELTYRDTIAFIKYTAYFMTSMCGWIYKDVLVDSERLDICVRTQWTDCNYEIVPFERLIFHDYSTNTIEHWLGFAGLIGVIIMCRLVIKYCDRQRLLIIGDAR